MKNPDSTMMPVMDKACSECLFSPHKIVNDKRKEKVLKVCERSGRAFECHKATIAGEYRVCRLFFDGNYSLAVCLAKSLERYKFQGLRDLENPWER